MPEKSDPGSSDSRTNWTIILSCCFSVAVVYFMPHIVNIVKHGESPAFLYVDEASYAGAITTSARERGFGFGEVYLYEHKDDPFLYPKLPFCLLGGIAKILGTELTFILLHGLGPPLTFLLLYLVLIEIGLSRFVSLAASLTYAVQFHMVDSLNNFVTYFGISGIFDYLIPIRHEFSTIFSISRVPDPALSRPFMFGALLLFLRLRRPEAGVRSCVLAAVSFIVCIYMRFYDWTVLIPVATFVMCLWYLKKERSAALKGLIALGVMLPFLLYYIIVRREFMVEFRDTFERNSLEVGRWLWPETGRDALVLTLMIIAAASVYRSRVFIYVLFTFISILLLMNIQLLTGFNVGALHWKVFHAYPIVVTCFAGSFAAFLDSRAGRTASTALLVLICLHSLFGHIRMKSDPTHISLLSEVRYHSQFIRKGEVVCSRHSNELKAYQDVFSFVPYGTFSSGRNSEFVDRLAIQAKILGMPCPTDEDVRAAFFLQLTRFNSLPAEDRRTILDRFGIGVDGISRMSDLYKSLPADYCEMLVVVTKRFRIDYILVERQNAEAMRGNSRLIEVSRGPLLVLYKISKE